VPESASYLRYVPYDEPYPHQRDAMGTIREALTGRRDVLFEGATGTGKTLAALAPALDWADDDQTVVITTNVHQQMRQFRREAAAIAETEDVRAVVFRGKASMCHIDVGYRECQTLRDTTRDLVEVEREEAQLEREQRDLLERMQDGDDDAAAARAAIMDELDDVETEVGDLADQPTCDHYYRNLTTDTSDFFAWLYDGVRSPDDVYDYADRQGLCGYELLKEAVEGVDLVVCNYHHLLDPSIREQFLRWLDRDLDDIVAIVDEAHNVEDAARDHARRTLTERTLEAALEECNDTDDSRTSAAANVLGAFREALEVAYEGAFDFGEREQVGTDWTDLAVANENRRDDLTLAFLERYSGDGVDADVDEALALGDALDREYGRAYREGDADVRRESQTLQAARFVEAWMAEGADAGTYPVVSVRRDEGGDVYGRAELYTCIPERITRPLFDGLAASVLMSATLRPFEVTEAVLGLDGPETLAYGQQFPEERRRTFVVDGPSLFASRRGDPGVQDTVTDAIDDAIRFTPGNTLAFFPSYAEAERYHERLDVEATTYLDRPGTPAHDLRERFTADDDAVLLTSLWGTLGEGVSYDGDDARTAVVVGVPYPHLDERMEAVQAAYDAAFAIEGPDSAGWRYAVEVPTIRKTRQALGRVVRSPEDFGARVLLDGRYTERAEIEEPRYAVRGTFPAEERAEMVDLEPGKLKFAMRNFYQAMDAYGGEPPDP
jgi:DNA excision repair protein ERCC-2